MINVENTITAYEVGGQEIKGLPEVYVRVRSHWNRDTLVVLEFAGQKVTVAGGELIQAARNAMNTR